MGKKVMAFLMTVVMCGSAFIGCLVFPTQGGNSGGITASAEVLVEEVGDPDIGSVIADPFLLDEMVYSVRGEGLQVREPSVPDEEDFVQYVCGNKGEALGVLETVFAKRQEGVFIYFPEQGETVLAKRFLYDSFTHDKGNPVGGDYLFGFIHRIRLVSNDICEMDGKRYHRIGYLFDYMIDVMTERVTDIAVDNLLDTPRFRFVGEYGTDYKKLLAIHDWLKENVKYDYYYWALPQERRNIVFTAYSALHKREAVCKGYALAFYRLALSMGVDARYVRGLTIYDSSTTHAWNMARIGDKYYFFDPTWEAQEFTDPERHSNSFFAKGRAFFNTDHSPFGDELVDFSKYEIPDGSYIPEDVVERVGKVVGGTDTYYHDPLLWGVSEGIVKGYGDDDFGIGDECTREQVVTFLWRAAGSPEVAYDADNIPYTDVDLEGYYCDAVAWGSEYGVVNGIASDKFGVGMPCSRAELATFVWRYYGYQAPKDGGGYGDVDGSEYYGEAVDWGTEVGMFLGTDAGVFDPHAPVKRQDVFTVLYRAPF